MDIMHHMLPADEIYLCGALLLYGFLFGAVTRLVIAWKKRRAA